MLISTDSMIKKRAIIVVIELDEIDDKFDNRCKK